MNYLISYSLACILVVALVEWGKRQTGERYLASERRLGGVLGALSIAASWIWAPAIFVSTQVGFQWGYSGLVWFVIPNMLALMLFAPLAARVRQRIPFGYSYLQSLQLNERGFRKTQLVVLLVVQILSFAIQITAGAELLSFVCGASYESIVCFMTFVPLIYCLVSGLPSSVISDALQYVVMVAAIVLIFCGLPMNTEFSSALSAVPFKPFDPTMLVQFGLASTLTLLFGIFSDHQQWQRAFASRIDNLQAPFIAGGVLHGVVTFSLGTLGVLIAQTGYKPNSIGIVGAEYIAASMAPVFTAAFVVMALSGLCSTVSAALCAFSSLWATEIEPAKNPVSVSRKAMVLLVVLSFLIAIFRLPLIALWMTAGIVRLCVVAPTLWSVFGRDSFRGSIGTAAIVSSAVVGAPLYVYGTITNAALIRDIGMLICLFISVSICLAASRPRAGTLMFPSRQLSRLGVLQLAPTTSAKRCKSLSSYNTITQPMTGGRNNEQVAQETSIGKTQGT